MSKNVFNSVQYPKVGSNTFDLSHDVKLSFKMGRLYPTMVMDCIPGDRIRLRTETMLRFAPLISPVMHRVNVTTHFFFVPNRIVWPNWEKWITGELEVEAPYFTGQDQGPSNAYPVGCLADYMGIPTSPGAAMQEISALPFAAYALIWDEFYRDQNLQDEVFTALVDGDNTSSYRSLARGVPLQRAWMHDYFTSALPFAQKGDSVQLPLFSATEDVEIQYRAGYQPRLLNNLVPVQPPATTQGVRAQAGTGDLIDSGTTKLLFDPNGSLVADTESLEAGAADINTLRRAFRLQEWLERNARGGTRYIENIMAHFGVKSSDARLNRPEFLGGSYQKMVISEVLSTAETVAVPVGQMAGHGISVGSGKEFSYYCEEHGWIIGLINVQPVTAYQNGIDRKFSREDRLDYYWPTFAHIGEQEVKGKEVMASFADPAYNESTFGYVPRYAEYRFMNSRVAGEMRTTLAHWHLGRIFSGSPVLNETFIASNPSTRIFAVQSQEADHIYGHIFNDVKALRKIPKFGTPSF